jgi:hypothetical protein
MDVMMRRLIFTTRNLFLLCSLGCLCTGLVLAAPPKDEGPQPRAVDPGSATLAPSDAVVLFDGRDVKQWVTAKDGEPCRCSIEDGAMACLTGVGDTVLATVAVAIAAGASLPLAAELGLRAAALVVQKQGTEVITLEELRG